MKYSIKTKMTKEECIEYTKDILPKSGWLKNPSILVMLIIKDSK